MCSSDLDELRIAIDANQRWNVQEAIDWTRELLEFDPYWIEEPTSPDDILGHAAIRRAVVPVKVATGEHVQNRIVFKQLIQAGSIDVLQLDSARVGGVNENLAILLLADAEPEWLVSQVDFRYIADELTPDEALELLRAGKVGAAERQALLREQGFPAYTTQPGWLGYSDEKLTRLAKQALAQGFTQIKLKVGADLQDDLRRFRAARAAVGTELRIAIDANQRWNVQEAIDWVKALEEFEPYWIEEPTSPDDILGHAAIRRGVAPVKVATGEHVQNRIIFKQMLQAGSIDILQLDSARVAGVNENLAILLLAAKFGVPVCPHAGGVGLCELVQHLSMFDYVALSGSMQDRIIEYVDHLHEHFTNPVRMSGANYQPPTAPGFSAEMYPESIATYRFPDGTFWLEDLRRLNKGVTA